MSIIVVMGVAGSGKTTIGMLLAARLGCPFTDADTLHSAANKAKMAAGLPLDDADRQPWLASVRAAIETAQRAGQPHVFACSALKAAYRDALSQGDTAIRFVFLHGSPALLAERLAGRSGHFFNPALLDSQLATLEAPIGALQIDIAAPPASIVTRILAALQ
ncbi:gluconokinase [Andreprevotia lacus]|nr:gluconokinase [Andreprevotia lacus]